MHKSVSSSNIVYINIKLCVQISSNNSFKLIYMKHLDISVYKRLFINYLPYKFKFQKEVNVLKNKITLFKMYYIFFITIT